MSNFQSVKETSSDNQDNEIFSGEHPVIAELKWFNGPKGFGFVIPQGTDIDAFLHITTLQKANIKALGEGAELKCTIEQGPKGAQVKEVIELLKEGDDPKPLKDEKDYFGGDKEEIIELEGTVKWYRPERGFGFVVPDDGKKDVFVHQSCLEKHDLETLEEGVRLAMKVKIVPKGREVVSFEFIN